MGIYEDQFLPRMIDKLLGNERMAKVRQPALAGLHGTVLEIGFGSGPNVPHYPAEVTRVLAVDPAVTARKLAEPRIARSHVEVEYIGLDGQSLPLEDESVDAALSTWTLCSIPDVEAALAEVRRVLKPGARFHFLEHGLSPEERVASWQRRLTPLQKRVGGGCHLDRNIHHLVEEAGFQMASMKRFNIAGPKVASHMHTGVAVKV